MVTQIARTNDAWTTWETTGNLIVYDMFSWLFDGVTIDGKLERGIKDLIDEEFNMYLHHQREVNGESNRGWLRIMYFGLTQQIIRQDLGIWMLYVALRPDRNPNLILYPYYAKYAREGDSTAFRHIDMNSPQYLSTGRGKNIIQGSVSLDDETVESGCTELIPGFHRHVKAWWVGVHATEHQDELTVGGLFHSVGKLWKSEHTRAYGGFVPFPCIAGAVRVTRPEILHGSTASKGSTGVRRTILP